MSTSAIAFKDLPLSDNFMFGQVMRDERVSSCFGGTAVVHRKDRVYR